MTDDLIKTLQKELREADDRIAKLEAALKPFADHTELLDAFDADYAKLLDAFEYNPDDTIICGFDGKYLTAGDCRAAKKALEKGDD